MNTRRFFEAMNEVSDKYYEEAANYASKRKSHSWLKGGYMAACLVVMLAVAIYVLPNFLGQHGITSPAPLLMTRPIRAVPLLTRLRTLSM